jgi:hypothetical protein
MRNNKLPDWFSHPLVGIALLLFALAGVVSLIGKLGQLFGWW